MERRRDAGEGVKRCCCRRAWGDADEQDGEEAVALGDARSSSRQGRLRELDWTVEPQVGRRGEDPGTAGSGLTLGKDGVCLQFGGAPGAAALGKEAARVEDSGASVRPGGSARTTGRICGKLEAYSLGRDQILQLQGTGMAGKAMESSSGGGGQIHGGDGAPPVKTTREGGYTERQGKKENGRRGRREGRRGMRQLRRAGLVTRRTATLRSSGSSRARSGNRAERG